MKIFKMIVVLLFIFLCSGLSKDNFYCAFGAASEEEAVRQVIMSALDGMEEGNIAKFMRDFSEKEFHGIMTGGPNEGKTLSYDEFKKDVLSFNAEHLTLSVTDREFSEIKIEGSEALVKVGFSKSLLRFSNKETIVQNKSAAISLKKQDDEWKIIFWENLPNPGKII